MKSPVSLVEVSCNICNSTSEEIISKTGIGNIVRCKKCGLLYRNPRLSDRDEIDKYKHQIYDESYGLIEDKSKKEIFVSILNNLEHYKGKILDIGCADGYFLALARERGWEPYGIEISDFLLRKARESLGSKYVFGVPLKMADFPPNYFDVISMWDVLDHLMDPLGELMEIRRILKKKGLLIIRVRNIAFHILVNKLFKKNLFGIIKKPTIFHLYGFNNKNIKVLLEKANLSKLKIGNSKLTSGDPYSQIEFLGDCSTNFIKRIYYAFSQLISFLSSKSLLISPSIIIYAEKI
ncbi:MAG: class I SAM-dependent methyltransferase [Candidatus Stahlbacteria bacterium]|nr:MAG: class I SAM-dependent methyltransferase [Candidatus Stahlbacteria bacterium]